MGNERQRGFTLIDGLAASIILALAVTASFTAWAVMFRHNAASRLMSEAGQLARAEVERAKLSGADNLPLGTYNAGNGTAVWTGVFDPTTSTWSAGGSTYYDAFGNRLSGASSAGAALSVQTTITDSNVLPRTGGYSLQPESRRVIGVKVTKLSDASLVLQVATIIVQGGL